MCVVNTDMLYVRAAGQQFRYSPVALSVRVWGVVGGESVAVELLLCRR